MSSERVVRELDAEAIIRRVEEQMPEVTVQQMYVPNPSDYKYLWWFSLLGYGICLQIEGPNCPLMLETDMAYRVRTVDEGVSMITTYLRAVLEGKPEPIHLEGEPYWGER